MKDKETDKQAPEISREVEGGDMNADFEEFSRLSMARAPLDQKVIYELSHNLFDINKIRMITRLNPQQIESLIKVYLVIELYIKRYINPESPLYSRMDEAVNMILELMISESGKGREDIVRMVQGIQLLMNVESKKGRILGR